MKVPSFSDLQSAHARISPFVHHTPVLSSSSINRELGAEFFFKCENFQKVGAFKYRGATNAVRQLTPDEMENGVVTHSSGNHAQALALAAKLLGIKAYIVMPSNAPKSKIDAVRSYGGETIFCEPTLEARESTTERIIVEQKAVLIHPYDNFNIIAGQGTAAKELIEDTGHLDVVMAPVGGGGLLSGTSIASRHLLPHAKVIAGEPLNADDAARSFYSGELVPSVNPITIADGLKTSLSNLTFGIIKKNVDEIFTATEESIARAMKLIWQRLKIIAEPSAAVPLAAVMEKVDYFAGKRIGIIISGGNLDFGSLPFE